MRPSGPRGLTLGRDHNQAIRSLLSNFMEAAARYPSALSGFPDAYEQADRLAGAVSNKFIRSEPADSVDLDADDALLLVRLLERSIRWIPEFDDIQTLTGLTLDEAMQFYLDLKNALGLYRVEDWRLAEGQWTTPYAEYPSLPRLDQTS